MDQNVYFCIGKLHFSAPITRAILPPELPLVPAVLLGQGLAEFHYKLKPEPPSRAAPGFLTQKLWVVIHVFRLLNLG